MKFQASAYRIPWLDLPVPRWLRAGLAPPNASLRQSASFFQTVLDDPLSTASIDRARDAFSHAIMSLNKDSIAAKADKTSLDTVYVGHIHDEASLRVRSYIADADGKRTLTRGRASKVQINLVHVGGASWKEHAKSC